MCITAKSRGNAGTSGLSILPQIAALSGHIIVKHIQDGFERQALNTLLETLKIGEVEIVGLDGLYCVRATALGAVNRGYLTQINPELVLTAAPEKWPGIAASLQKSGAVL